MDRVRPSLKGLPTIYDKDLIIYAISHLVAGLEEGDDIPKTVEIDPYSFFLFTQRGTGGRDYQALVDSLDRIDGTRYRTNVVFSGTKTDEWMGIIDKASLETDEKTHKPDGVIEYQVVRKNSNESVFDYKEEVGSMQGVASSQVTVEKMLPLQNLSPGDYVLKMKVIDRISNQTITPSASFKVTS